MNKITKICVDEQNREYSVTTANGKVYTGYKALNLIRIHRVRGANGQEYLESYIQPQNEIQRDTDL